MAYLTGPQALVDLIQTEWQESRTGRADVPPILTDSDDPKLTNGVIVLRDREDVKYDTARHDLVHCYHPEASGLSVEDRGFKEQNTVENVQIDIELTDRTDHDLPAGQQRLSARDRMVGLRSDLADPNQPPYPGIFGEVKYILETVRRGYEEWDTVSHDVINSVLGNSNATMSLNIELERIADPTVQ